MLATILNSNEEGHVTITIICRDLDSDDTAVFKAPVKSMCLVNDWLVNHLINKFLAAGMNIETAKDRAADFEIRCAFSGDCLELKI